MKQAFFLVIFILFMTACGTALQEEANRGEEGKMEGNWKLTGTFDQEEYKWKMGFENISDDPIMLYFRSGQEIEVTIKREKEEDPVYQYSADKMFTQALKSITVESGTARTWKGEVPENVLDEAGTYNVTFEVIAKEINGKELKSPLQTTQTFIVD